MNEGGRATLSPELMDDAREAALRGALERLYESDDLAVVWPAAHDAKLKGDSISLDDVKIVVLPLDRIGAPAGASGSNVYVAYYSHAVDIARRRRPSAPVVVKIGTAEKLREEMDGALTWPGLAPMERSKFAFPIKLDDADPERTVLIAPFQSTVRAEQDGSRNAVEVRDLWRLLDDKEELTPAGGTDWAKVERLVGEALDAVQPPHAFGMARMPRVSIRYAEDYERYLRKTQPSGRARHVPEGLFGLGTEVEAFGRTWPNPVRIVDSIVGNGLTFEGVRGAVHGDLHPKNIVLSSLGNVQIIDFGWAWHPRHVLVDYLMLDLNLRGTTLPSQIDEASLLSLAGFLDPADQPGTLHASVRNRARIIKDVIWAKAADSVVKDWDREYLTPLLLVGYGLLVHLDTARNQVALTATVLQLGKRLEPLLAGSATT